jgi:hypothetical protein
MKGAGMELIMLSILLIVTIIREFITEKRLKRLEKVQNLQNKEVLNSNKVQNYPKLEELNSEETTEEREQRLELEHFSNDVKAIFGYYAGMRSVENSAEVQ